MSSRGSARSAVLVLTAALGVGLGAVPAHAASCQTSLVNRPTGASSACSAFSTNWTVVGVTGVTGYSVTCNGMPVATGTIGTNTVFGSPGPCNMTLTITAQANGTTAVGFTD